SIPALYRSMGVYLALITTNCAVLGVTINCISKNYNYGESLVYALGSALGFLISMVVMSGVRSRLKIAKLPRSFQGTPVLYVAAGLLSLAFLGFKGLIK
ncbi:MAG: electron transport complex subunit RsxA, partial [Treponema sp.]|nr:electron transport complex subunit RsxA [Treponema sp.]